MVTKKRFELKTNVIRQICSSVFFKNNFYFIQLARKLKAPYVTDHFWRLKYKNIFFELHQSSFVEANNDFYNLRILP